MQTFRGLVGVNTHLEATTSAPYNDYSAVAAKLTDLGVRHIRQPYSAYSTVRARIAAMPATVNLLIGSEHIGSMGAAVAIAKTDLPNLGSLEGVNEHDLTGTGWEQAVKNAALELATRVRKDPDLDSFPLVAPSLVWDGSHASMADWFGVAGCANKHPYPGGQWQTTALSDAQLVQARKPVSRPGAPVWATEWGYHTTTGWSAPGHPPVTETQQRDRLIAGLLTMQATWDRVYVYELCDIWSTDSQDSRFGLYRNDGTAKPAATALKHWLGWIGDLQPAASTFGFTHTAGIRSREFERSNGDHVVAFWREADAAAQTIQVNMTDGLYHWTFARYRSSGGSAATGWASSAKAYAIPSVSNEPVLLLIRPEV